MEGSKEDNSFEKLSVDSDYINQDDFEGEVLEESMNSILLWETDQEEKEILKRNNLEEYMKYILKKDKEQVDSPREDSNHEDDENEEAWAELKAIQQEREEWVEGLRGDLNHIKQFNVQYKQIYEPELKAPVIANDNQIQEPNIQTTRNQINVENINDVENEIEENLADIDEFEELVENEEIKAREDEDILGETDEFVEIEADKGKSTNISGEIMLTYKHENNVPSSAIPDVKDVKSKDVGNSLTQEVTIQQKPILLENNKEKKDDIGEKSTSEIPASPDLSPKQITLPTIKKDTTMQEQFEQIKMLEEDNLSHQIREQLLRNKYKFLYASVPNSKLQEFVESGRLQTTQPEECLSLDNMVHEDHFVKFKIHKPPKIDINLVLNSIKTAQNKTAKEERKIIGRENVNMVSERVNGVNATNIINTPNTININHRRNSLRRNKKKENMQEMEKLKGELGGIGNKYQLISHINPKLSHIKQIAKGVTDSTYIHKINIKESDGQEGRIPLMYELMQIYEERVMENEAQPLPFKLPKMDEYLSKINLTRNYPQSTPPPIRSKKGTNLIDQELNIDEDLFAEENSTQLTSYLPNLAGQEAPAQIIEIKMKKIQQISNFSESYRNTLRVLRLGMNQIKNLSGLRSLCCLQELYLSQNKITLIPGKAMETLKTLKILHLDINLIHRIEGLDSCLELKVLKLDNNKLKVIEGLDKLTNLTHLHLYRNQIQEVEGLEQLTKLQHLDLGRNLLQDISYMTNTHICPLLQDLLLYFNKIQFVPKLSYLVMKSLYLNGNSITNFHIGFCPMLENLNLGENAIQDIFGLELCLNLKHLDLSFNNISNIGSLFRGIKANKLLEVLKYHDNPIEKERSDSFIKIIHENYPVITEINKFQGGNTAEGFKNYMERRCTLYNAKQTSQYSPYIIWGCSNMLNMSSFLTLERSFYTKVLSAKFIKSNIYFRSIGEMQYSTQFYPLMNYNLLLDSKTPQKHLLKLDSLNYIRQGRSKLLQEHKAIKVIICFLMKRLWEKKMWVSRQKNNSNKIRRIQATWRGYKVREGMKEIILHRKKLIKDQYNKKFLKVIKIQALVRGFLLRNRIKKALTKLQPIEEDEFEPIDIDNFLNLNDSEEFTKDIFIPEDAMIKNILENVDNLSYNPFNELKEAALLNPIQEEDSVIYGGEMGIVNEGEMTLPPLQAKYVNMLPKTYGMGQSKDPKRPPTATTNNLSEIELRSEHSTLRGSRHIMAQLQEKNNYLGGDMDISPYGDNTYGDYGANIPMRNQSFLPSVGVRGQKVNIGSSKQNHNIMGAIGPLHRGGVLRESADSENSIFHTGQHKMKVDKNLFEEERRKIADEQKEVRELTEKAMEEWKFANPETKKIWQARIMKKRKVKKTGPLTAEQKYHRFLINSQQNKNK